MKKIIFVGVVAILASCTPKASEVADKAPISYPTTEIAQGKGLYDSKCSTCHKLKTVDKFSTEQWAKILPDMAGKAELPDNETALIKEFITWELGN